MQTGNPVKMLIESKEYRWSFLSLSLYSVNEVGKNQRLRTVGFRIARAVGVLTPQSFPRTRMRLTEMVCCSGGGSGSTYCVGRHQKPWLIAKWAGSYRESDPAKTVVF